MLSPDVLPASSFDPPVHCVTVVHRACGGLAAGEVGELAGGLLDAARGGKIGEGEGALVWPLGRTTWTITTQCRLPGGT